MEPVKADLKVSLDAIHRALDNLPEAQINNRATRSMHAAAFATAQGELRLVREDVGRHNALDKLIGGCCAAGSTRPRASASSPAAAPTRWCRRRW